MNEFCKNLPKIELHAHLNGSLSSQTLKKLGCFDESIEEYHRLNKVMERSSRTLDECFLLFKVAHNATRTKEAVYTATKDVIEEFFNDNVIYLELRTTPRSEECMTMEEYVETVVKAIQDNKLNIIVKLLLSIDRRYQLPASDNVMNLIIKMKNKYPDIIKGVDLSGNPNVGIFNSELFKKAKESGLSLSLHCGEVKNDKEVEEMLFLNPDRIGHATCIHPKYEGSEELWNLYCQKLIPAECCLTSNVVCGTSKSYANHHILEWIKNDLPFTISTDDKGVFNTTLSTEYELLQKHFDLNDSDLWKINYNSIDYSFAESSEKDKLRDIMLEWKTKYMK